MFHSNPMLHFSLILKCLLNAHFPSLTACLLDGLVLVLFYAPGFVIIQVVVAPRNCVPEITWPGKRISL